MKTPLILVCLLATSAIAQEAVREQFRRHQNALLIPEYVECEPPPPFFRAQRYKDNPPAPNFYHPKNGGSELSAELKFSFQPVGVWMGEGKRVFQRPITWTELREEIQKKGQIVEGTTTVSESLLDGKRVLLFDYQQHLSDAAPWRHFYITKLWIPVDDNIVVEGSIVCSSPELRQSLRDALLKIKIRKYKTKEEKPNQSPEPTAHL
jgi:hypothetical protein